MWGFPLDSIHLTGRVPVSNPLLVVALLEAGTSPTLTPPCSPTSIVPFSSSLCLSLPSSLFFTYPFIQSPYQLRLMGRLEVIVPKIPLSSTITPNGIWHKLSWFCQFASTHLPLEQIQILHSKIFNKEDFTFRLSIGG